MKGNKLLSIFLLASVATSIFAGFLSIQKNRYAQANAVVTYRTIYLSVPEEQITDGNDSNPKYWDIDDDLRVFLTGKHDAKDQDTGDPMIKISNHLYTFTIESTYSQFNFLSYINDARYADIQLGVNFHRFNDINDNANYFIISKYNVTSRNDAGSWYPAKNYIDAADKFAKTFLGVLHGTCDNSGDNTDMTKLSSVWNEMKYLFTSAAFVESELNKLKNAKKDDADIFGDFAKLYDLIYSKYHASLSDNFVGRTVTPLSSIDRTIISIDKGNTNMIVAVSIGATSIAIVSVYFFLRKRKEK